MKEDPVKIKLLEVENSNYKIRFPDLSVPVVVNKYIYQQMLNSDEYKFINDSETIPIGLN